MPRLLRYIGEALWWAALLLGVWAVARAALYAADHDPCVVDSIDGPRPCTSRGAP